MRVFSFSPRPPGAPYELELLRPSGLATSTLARMVVVPWMLNFRDTSGLDVLHLHGDDWFFFRRRLPTLRTFHGSALQEARHATSWRRRLRQGATFPLEVLASRLATRAYGVTPGADPAYRTRGGLPCGISPPDDATLDRGGPPSILFVGTLQGRKRGDLLAEAFVRHVRPQLPDAELWMVADADPGVPGVRWIEAPSDTELVELYRRAWVFCLPSSYEGYGIPYVEAMAQGTPVVATHNPGSEFLLSEGAGLLVEERELGEALARVLTDRSLRSGLAERGRRRAHDFDWDKIVAAHERAYQGAIDAWRRRRG